MSHAAPQTKCWNLGFKTASSTYDRLAAGVGAQLTDRRIAEYCRTGYYGDKAQAAQLELDKKRKLSKGTSQEKLSAMVDDLAD